MKQKVNPGVAQFIQGLLLKAEPLLRCSVPPVSAYSLITDAEKRVNLLHSHRLCQWCKSVTLTAKPQTEKMAKQTVSG